MSSRERKNYLRAEKAKHDKDQMVLCFSGIKPNPKVVVVAHETLLQLNKQVSCPFCLGLSEFRRFLISTKQGISRSLGKCPLCNLGLNLKSLKLMSTTNAPGYARWVFSYKGFWKKINFSQWKGRLQLIGWTREFWDQYKALKGEQQEEGGESESFTDYINRKGREQADEWNKEDRSQEERREIA